MVESIRRRAPYTCEDRPRAASITRAKQSSGCIISGGVSPVDTGVSASSGAGNIWARGAGVLDEDMPGWESFEMLFCVRVHSFQEDNLRGTRAD